MSDIMEVFGGIALFLLVVVGISLSCYRSGIQRGMINTLEQVLPCDKSSAGRSVEVINQNVACIEGLGWTRLERPGVPDDE